MKKLKTKTDALMYLVTMEDGRDLNYGYNTDDLYQMHKALALLGIPREGKERFFKYKDPLPLDDLSINPKEAKE